MNPNKQLVHNKLKDLRSWVEVDVANTPIALAQNWNWISYLPQISWDVDSAFSSITLTHEEYLKTQKSVSNYYEGWGWYPGASEGFLLNPGDGLMLNVANADVLIYPESNALTMSHSDAYFETLDDLNQGNLLWDVDYHKFEFNGSLTSKVMINGITSASEGDLLAVFSGLECRGVAQARTNPFNDDYVFLLMAYSNKADGEELSISYYDAKNKNVPSEIWLPFG